MKITKIFWVGFLISISVVGFVLGLMFLQEMSFNKSNYSFTVMFDNIQGLNEGDNVSMLGKRIGRVSKTKIIGKKIAIEMTIDDQFAFSIPIDSEIEVKSEGLLGEKYVSIKPGLKTTHYISPGETVEGTREYDFSEITPGIMPITQDIGAFARRLKATLGENEEVKIKQTIANLESLSSETTDLIKDFRDVLSDEEKNNLRNFSNNLKNITDSLKLYLNNDFRKLDQILEDVHTITTKSKEFAEIIDLLKSGAETLNESSSKFDSFTEKLEHGNGTMQKIMNDDSIYKNIDSLIIDIRNIVKDFDENPGKYLKAYIKAKLEK
ncbi:MAG: MCE family protein [Candidatus Marinimicrobia bacterium]|nr:MCE family protein [Candidatus Neomarinimicrobiota bacterium]MBL7022641.1 MCE family protein [Candidatus Neomarinimicrobiota bacterium]